MNIFEHENLLGRGKNPLNHNINAHIQNQIYGKMKESAAAIKRGDTIKAKELKQEAAYLLQREELRNSTTFTGPVNSLKNSDAELDALLDKVLGRSVRSTKNQTNSNEVDSLIDRVFRTK